MRRLRILPNRPRSARNNSKNRSSRRHESAQTLEVWRGLTSAATDRLDSSRQPGSDEHRLPRRHRRPALGGELNPKSEVGRDGALRHSRAVQARNHGYTVPDLHNSFRPLNAVGDSGSALSLPSIAKRYLGVRVEYFPTANGITQNHSVATWCLNAAGNAINRIPDQDLPGV